MNKFLIFVMVIICAAITASAQTENVKGRDTGHGAATNHVDASDVDDDQRDVSARRISYEYTSPHSKKIGVVRIGSPTTYLKRGLTVEDVMRVLGEPAGLSTRIEDGKVVTIYEFQRGGERMLVAEFVNDRLIRSRTEKREQVARAER
ncbi:MAG: hypothetical protein ABR501_01285 [Pyrinomonadaceae bacterium]